MTIALPIEIKVREYLSKAFLAYKIVEKSDQNVVIGEKNQVHNLFKTNKNIFLLSKGGPVKLFKFYKKNFKNRYLGVLDEEAPLMNIPIESLKSRIEPKIIKNVDNYFFWGKKDYKEIKKILKNKITKKSYNFGHPKFDLLTKPNINIFNKEVKEIKKKYKNLVFIPSSFVYDQIQNEYVGDKFQIFSSNIKIQSERNLYKNRKFIEKENYDYFLKLIIKLAETNSNYNFVFRPHPRQSIKLIKKRFSNKPKNLHFIYEKTATPWIIASKLYIHYGCTTSLEAAFLKKKIIFYAENEKAFSGRDLEMFKTMGHSFNNYEKCLFFLNKNFKKKLSMIKESKKPTKYIYNTSKSFFWNKFLKLINKKYKKKLTNLDHKEIKKNLKKNKLEHKKNYFLSNFKSFLLKSKIISDILFIIDPSLTLGKSYKKQKFNKLTLREIKGTFDNFRQNLKSKKKIVISQINDNLFLIHKK
jgi:surface carbohydrate biosynthesis protein